MPAVSQSTFLNAFRLRNTESLSLNSDALFAALKEKPIQTPVAPHLKGLASWHFSSWGIVLLSPLGLSPSTHSSKLVFNPLPWRIHDATSLQNGRGTTGTISLFLADIDIGRCNNFGRPHEMTQKTRWGPTYHSLIRHLHRNHVTEVEGDLCSQTEPWELCCTNSMPNFALNLGFGKLFLVLAVYFWMGDFCNMTHDGFKVCQCHRPKQDSPWMFP